MSFNRELVTRDLDMLGHKIHNAQLDIYKEHPPIKELLVGYSYFNSKENTVYWYTGDLSELWISGGGSGTEGPKGETGAKGDPGKEGPQGPQGVPGLKGDVGPKGETGPQGPIGPVGPAGKDGEQGLRGATGATGSQGIKGEKGDGSNEVFRKFTPGGFGWGAEASLRTTTSQTFVCNDADEYASIPKNTFNDNNFYTLNMVTSSMGYNGIKKEDVVGTILPTKVEHSFALFCKGHKFVVDNKPSVDSLALHYVSYDNPTQAKNNNQIVYNNKITILINDEIAVNGKDTNHFTIFANCIDNKGNHTSISYHKVYVEHAVGDTDTFTKNLEFEIKPIIKYTYADATNTNGLNQTYSSNIYPNAYIIQKT